MSRPDSLLELIVPGVPIPQGSKRVVPTAAGHRVIEGNEKTLRPWRSTIALAAADAFDGQATREPVIVTLTFLFPRPRFHYGTGRNARELRDSAPAAKVTKPDLDKLVRAVLDALTGVAFVDDSQVVELIAVKGFGPAGAYIRVEIADYSDRWELVAIEGESPYGVDSSVRDEPETL